MVSEKTTDAALPEGQGAGARPILADQTARRVIVMGLGALGIVMAINQQFLLNLFGFQPLGNAYLYYLIGIFLAVAFLTLPASTLHPRRLRWLDPGLAVAALVSAGWLGLHGLDIIQKGWEYDAPPMADLMASVLIVLVLEGVRRAGGTILLVTALLFGTYPLYADYMPGFLWGTEYSLIGTVRAHVLGVESIIGIPMQVVAELVIGFVIFGSVLVATKGSDFFMELASALLGHSRGGPAKVAVMGSGILGSLSGSVISNILTSGPFSIPTMRRVGYPAHYAAAVEACASTGATLMPPVMGTVAFVMASFLGVQYSSIVVAAVIPALMFYVALLFQVDMYAARRGLKGLPRSEMPALWPVLKSGWPYLLSLAVLIFVLMGLRMEARSPYYASVVMLVATAFNKDTRLTLARAKALLLDTSANVANLVAVLAGIGLVVGGLSYTGVAGAFSRELLLYAGGNTALMLIAGAVTSFVLGMGMTVTACYIFLSILLAPALVQAGLNPIASHLFILYWGMLSYITPPVALAAITAANVAGSKPMQTGLHAMRLGMPLFVLPFIFVYDPALIMEGTWPQILERVALTLVAIWAITSGFEAWIYKVGRIGVLSRIAFALGGVLILVPELTTSLGGAGVLVAVIVVNLGLGRRRSAAKA
ncbi:TRAP transporter permease [Salipiger marinus]|uniref:TRAP transporter, 4TM/12TM fusion protein n=1 Tax=Salipiger marinus TaxID=555512 RepID=A0A1G8PCC4_9RHOB|nr:MULTISPECIES: TRAP transporter fused permease subunit [Salipiger]MCD1618953.1 TRAP transporter fused permease subunit [Salipiger manganoxidans]MEB3419863.1 TRAP transporter fused permease subunit [Salipiger manganoxidans]SDI89390.1 TRAP transporter, 4TM/12TM fusion protein [Salipiger marinus]